MSARSVAAPRQVISCGCSLEMRRVCDVCASEGGLVAACSLACLERHLAREHVDDESARGGSEGRARLYLAEVNRRLAGSRKRYAEHRQQVMALALGVDATPLTREPVRDIVIFGAGNGTDLDLPRLAENFREIHLVDLDGDALERARDELPATARVRVMPHAPVDLSGFMSHIDEWGDCFPDDPTLGRTAFAAARALVGALGRDFDVALSTGTLSQLIVPFHRTWLASRADWERLDAAIVAVHLATLVLSTRSGGRGALAFDVLSSKALPSSSALAGCGDAELGAVIDAEVLSGGLRLHPDPVTLREQLQLSGMAAMLREPRLSGPWLWDLGDAVQLVYGLEFRRP